MKVDAADADELRYKGWLGHLVVVLTDAGSLECNNVSEARRYADENAASRPRIYRRRGAGGRWSPVAWSSPSGTST